MSWINKKQKTVNRNQGSENPKNRNQETVISNQEEIDPAHRLLITDY